MSFGKIALLNNYQSKSAIVNSKINNVNKEDDLIIEIRNKTKIKSDQILVATGRKPNTSKLHLENAGVNTDEHGAIIVDKNSMTNVETIYAIGDVTNKINLTPVALGEGHSFADREFGGSKKYFDYDNVPYAVFSQPPVSAVGLSEEDALNLGYSVEIYTSNFKPLKHTISGSKERSFMKLVIDKKTNIPEGSHLVLDKNASLPNPKLGHVSASCWSVESVSYTHLRAHET